MNPGFARNKNWLSLLLLLVLCLHGCDSSSYKANHHFSGEEWPGDEIISFEFIPHQHGNYQPSVWFRHTTDYPYLDLHCLISITGDYVTLLADTLHLQLATPDGIWKGQGINGFKTFSTSLSHPVQLDSAKHYTITIRQLMKDNPLPAISDTGITLELQTTND